MTLLCGQGVSRRFKEVIMQRTAWLVVLAILTVAVTVEIVRAQILFPDGTMQDTAFLGDTAVPVGAAYTRTFFFPGGTASAHLSTDNVPSGQELVILKVIGWNTTLSTLDSRLPSPNQNNSPITLAMLVRPTAVDNAFFEMDFPDGAVIVGQGRRPYLAFRDGATFNVTNAPNAQSISVIGYLRPTS
jgi:hypothetical protein